LKIVFEIEFVEREKITVLCHIQGRKTDLAPGSSRRGLFRLEISWKKFCCLFAFAAF